MAAQSRNQLTPSSSVKPPVRAISLAPASSSPATVGTGIPFQGSISLVSSIADTAESQFSVDENSSTFLQAPTVSVISERQSESLAENSFELINESGALYEQETVLDGELLGRCKSWLTSMVLHLAIIIGLALFSMKGEPRPEVMLQVAVNGNSAMMELEDFDFESGASEWEEETEEPMQQELSAEALEVPDDIDLLEDVLADAIDIGNPLFGDSSILKNASRDASNDILNLRGGESSFFGIETSGESIVYIVDRSLSMEGARWRNATRELVKSIESLKPEQKFYVYLFSSSCHPMPRMEQTKSKEMPFATEANINRFKKWLFRQSPSGSTMPLASIKRAIRQEPATIFLLTDGQIYDDTGGYLLNRAIAQRSRTDPDEFVINTIAFHCQVGLEMLMDIATVYDGTFRSVE